MILAKPITPKKFNDAAFRQKQVAAAKKLLPKIEKDFAATVRTWDDKPEFQSVVDVGTIEYAKPSTKVTTGIVIEVYTEDPVYHFVDAGTKVRYATMSKDFQSKTVPNKLTTRAGRGRMLFVSKKRPRPGIKARNFSKQIKKKHAQEFKDLMQNATNDGAAASQHGRKK